MQRLLVSVMLAAALLAAGCGGSDDDSDGTSATTEWASDICTAVSAWADTLTSSANSLQGGNISRDSLESAAEDVKSATDTLVDDLRGVGRPDTDAGQQAKDSVDQLAGELEQEADKIESAVEDVSGVSGVLNAVSTVTATLATMSTQVTSTVDELEQLDAQGELRDAFEEAPPCSELSSLRPG
jgi:methyl-accepting chemotaxis protein